MKAILVSSVALVMLLCCVSLVPLIMLALPATLVPQTILVIPLASMPLAMYLVASIFVWRHLGASLDPRPEVEKRLHDKQARSLTLAGFCLTALAILLRFYGAESVQHDEAAISLALSLGFFVAVYLLLRYRMKEWSDYFSDALLDSGLWCILISLAFLFGRVVQSACAVAVIGVLLVGFVVYIVVHLVFTVRNARRIQIESEV